MLVNMLTMGPTHQLNYLIQHLSSVISRQIDQLLQEHIGIGLSQYRILTALEWSPRVQQKTIALNLGQTEASVSRQITLLTRKGLVTTRAVPTNRRKHVIVPTPTGMQLTEAGSALIRRNMGPDYASLGERQQQLLAGLQALHLIICTPGKPGVCDHSMGA